MTSPSSFPTLSASDIQESLDRWFSDGHTRLVMPLSGARAGNALLAQPSASGAELFEREVLSDSAGVILSRKETPISLAEFAQDSVNAHALIKAVEMRLAGAIAPPAICSKRAAPK